MVKSTVTGGAHFRSGYASSIDEMRRKLESDLSYSDLPCSFYTSPGSRPARDSDPDPHLLHQRADVTEAGLVQSMGSRGDCFDNAMPSPSSPPSSASWSFFGTVVCELLDRQTFHTRAQARMEVFDFIEGYYNTQRRHSSLSLPGLGMQCQLSSNSNG